MDRPAVQSGRMPANAIEAAITVDTAVSQGLGIGDTVEIAFWQPRVNPYLGLEPVGEYGDEIIEPIAVEEVEIVGIVVLPGQVLPDELFRRAEMIVSPELSARYDCVPDIPRPGATFAEAVATLLPADCKVAFPTARCASPTARPRCNRRWTSSWTAPPG